MILRPLLRPLICLICLAGFATAACAAPHRSVRSRREAPPANFHDYRSAIVIDAATGRVLFQDHDEAESPPASVTKLMTFYLVEQAIKKGEFKLNTVVRIPKRAAEMGGSEAWLITNEPATIDQLLYLLMVPSANDAAVALAIRTAGSEGAFVDLMNREARALGMTHSVFHSPHGLPPGRGQLPTLSCAHDIALLCRRLLATTDILRYTSTRFYRFRHENGVVNKFVNNNNHLLATLPGCDGLKTGWYREAGYSIALTVHRNGRRVIAVVLGCPRRLLRDKIVTRLVDRAFAKLAQEPPATPVVSPAPRLATPPEHPANKASTDRLIPVPLGPGDQSVLGSDGGSPDTVHIALPKLQK